MEPNQRQDQYTTDREFLKSLNQLEQILEDVAHNDHNLDSESSSVEKSPQFDLSVWEDAIADIEEYFKKLNG